MEEIKKEIKKLQSLMYRGVSEQVVIDELDKIFDSIHNLEDKKEVKECLLALLDVSKALGTELKEKAPMTIKELLALDILEQILEKEVNNMDHIKVKEVAVRVTEQADKFIIKPCSEVSMKELDSIVDNVSPRYKKQVIDQVGVARGKSIIRLDFKYIKNIFIDLSSFVDPDEVEDYAHEFMIKIGLAK